MLVKQISVFLENKIGRLAEITQLLGEARINIRALAIADTTEFGILRLIVDDPPKAQDILEKSGFAVKQTEVVVVGVEDKPGGLANILKTLRSSNFNVEYLYAFVKQSGEDALVVFRIENTDEAIAQLRKEGFQIISPQDIYKL